LSFSKTFLTKGLNYSRNLRYPGVKLDLEFVIFKSSENFIYNDQQKGILTRRDVK